MTQPVIDKQQLEAINVNGFDLVMFALFVATDMISTMSKDAKETEQRLTDLANAVHTLGRKTPEPRLSLLLTQLAKGLIGTEKTT